MVTHAHVLLVVSIWFVVRLKVMVTGMKGQDNALKRNNLVTQMSPVLFLSAAFHWDPTFTVSRVDSYHCPLLPSSKLTFPMSSPTRSKWRERQINSPCDKYSSVHLNSPEGRVSYATGDERRGFSTTANRYPAATPAFISIFRVKGGLFCKRCWWKKLICIIIIISSARACFLTANK